MSRSAEYATEMALMAHASQDQMKDDQIRYLRAGIQAYLDGNYENPRVHRPNGCSHNREYYQECNICDSEHFEAVLQNRWEPKIVVGDNP